MTVKKVISSIIIFSVFGVFGQTKLIDDRFAFTPGLDFDKNIDSPETYLGYELGSEYTLYANVVSYLKYLSSNSDKIIMNSYGKTYEGRSLEYLIISSKKNISRLENIRKNNLLLSDPRNIKSSVASKIIKENPGIYWLSYNVHGNEASSTEAVMQVAYRLVASNDSETSNILNNSVVILFPCLNPDGRDRYVYWYKSAKSKILNTDQFDYEHDEPWPGGRTNHYWFDLNRDWVWTVHPESRGRMEVYQKWLPQIHVDYHEMGFNRNYFTMPGTTPRNLLLPDAYEALSDTFGLAHIASFDKHKISYYTREGFDFFYPGYGSSYPSLMGSIGMLVEQGGHSRGGRAVETDDGYVLTLRQRIFDHYETSFATLSAAVRNRKTLNQYLFDSFKQNTNKSKSKAYILPDNQDGYLYDVLNLMRFHGVEIEQATSDFMVNKAYDYETGKSSRKVFKKGDFIIYADQPRHLFVNTLFQREMEIEDSIMYDMSTWSIPLAYNLDAFWSENKIIANTTTIKKDLYNEKGFNDVENAYAYVIDWKQRHAPKALSKLWQKGYNVRSARKEFNNGKRNYSKGSLVVLVGRNLDKTNAFKEDMKNIAQESGVIIDVFKTGRMKKGVDLGSSNMVPLKKSKVALMVDRPFNSYTAGQLWFLMDMETQYGISKLRTERLRNIDLDIYDVIIFPGTRSSIDTTVMDKLKKWVNDGGVLVATEQSAELFSSKNNFNNVDFVKDEKNELKEVPPIAYTKYEDRADSLGLKRIPGTAFYGIIDNSNPLAFGLTERLYSLKQSTNAIEPSFSLQTVGYYHKDYRKLKVAGYASIENRKKLSGKTFAGVKDMGRGKVVYLVDNTQYRMFWVGPSRMVQNAAMLLPSM